MHGTRLLLIGVNDLCTLLRPRRPPMDMGRPPPCLSRSKIEFVRLTWALSRRQAPRMYSLMRPLRIGFRRIRWAGSRIAVQVIAAVAVRCLACLVSFMRRAPVGDGREFRRCRCCRVLGIGCVGTAPAARGGLPMPTWPMASQTGGLRPALGDQGLRGLTSGPALGAARGNTILLAEESRYRRLPAGWRSRRRQRPDRPLLRTAEQGGRARRNGTEGLVGHT